MSAAMLECTVLKGFNNTGTIKRLDNNYVLVVLGALEYPNSGGAVYDEGSGKEFFKSTSSTMRRIAQGVMYGELGHPPQRECKNYDDYVERIHTILEKNVAIHIRKAYLDYNYVTPDGRKCIAIMGEICPDGPHAAVVERKLNNPHCNLAFSIRSMATDKFVRGRKRKYLDNIITWDVVNEPGLDLATKFNSPSCESFTVETTPVRPDVIERLVERSKRDGVAVESALLDTAKVLSHLKASERLRNNSSFAQSWVKR